MARGSSNHQSSLLFGPRLSVKPTDAQAERLEHEANGGIIQSEIVVDKDRLGKTIQTLTIETWFDSQGNLHRENGPARKDVLRGEVTLYWYKHGEIHRDGAPAIETSIGSEEWYQNGQRHREDGLALIGRSGAGFWYLEDQQYRSKEDFQAAKQALLDKRR